MSEQKKCLVYKICAFTVCLCIIIVAPVMMFTGKKKITADSEMTVLKVWQIDNFEGGKGSRANYLQNIGNDFTKQSNCYVTVTAVTAEAALENLKLGIVPDMISYGAGMCGLEKYITGDVPYYCWCNGGYCFLSLEQNEDFANITAQNTVINSGTGNRVSACALLCGLEKANYAQPTAAYVKLINGQYRYLFGTQRDIFRLKTRGVQFSVKPITVFNDLYQNISITSKNVIEKRMSEKFIEKLLSESDKIYKLGLFANGQTLYDDEAHLLEGITYDISLRAPLSENAKNELDKAILNSDLNLIKNLLK